MQSDAASDLERPVPQQSDAPLSATIDVGSGIRLVFDPKQGVDPVTDAAQGEHTRSADAEKNMALDGILSQLLQTKEQRARFSPAALLGKDYASSPDHPAAQLTHQNMLSSITGSSASDVTSTSSNRLPVDESLAIEENRRLSIISNRTDAVDNSRALLHNDEAGQLEESPVAGLHFDKKALILAAGLGSDAVDRSSAISRNDETRPPEVSPVAGQSLQDLRQFAKNLKEDVSRDAATRKPYEPAAPEHRKVTNHLDHSDQLDGGGIVTREQMLSTKQDGLPFLTITETPQDTNCMETPFCGPTSHCDAYQHPDPYCADAGKLPESNCFFPGSGLLGLLGLSGIACCFGEDLEGDVGSSRARRRRGFAKVASMGVKYVDSDDEEDESTNRNLCISARALPTIDTVSPMSVTSGSLHSPGSTQSMWSARKAELRATRGPELTPRMPKVFPVEE